MRSHGRIAIASFVAGLVAVSSALAGIVVAPRVSVDDALPDAADVARAAGVPLQTQASMTNELQPEEVGAVVGSTVKAPDGDRTPAGTFLVGAARVSLFPTPTSFGGQT